MQRDATNTSNPAAARGDAALLAIIAFGTTIALRAFTLPLSVINDDENIFLLVARDILHGLLPYQGGFEHKPAALYYAFALAQLLFGQNIVAVRLLAIGACGGTAFLLGLVLRRNAQADMLTAGVAVTLYAVLSTLNGGLAANSEILANFYGVLAFFILGGGRLVKSFAPGRAVLFGAVCAVMFHTNYLAAFPIAGIGIGFVLSAIRQTGPSAAMSVWMGNVGVMAIGFFLGSAIILLPIAIWSDIADYFGRQHQFLSAYHLGIAPGRFMAIAIVSLMPYFVLIAPIGARYVTLILARADVLRLSPDCAIVEVQALAYAIAAFVAAIASGHYFDHYFILLLPGLCILAGIFLASVPAGGALRRLCAIWLIFLAIGSLGLDRIRFRDLIHGTANWWAGRPADLPAAIARDIEQQFGSGQSIYVYDYDMALYVLLDAPLPLRYFMPYHHLTKFYGRNPEAEMQTILASKPQFIITGSNPENLKFGTASRLLNDALNQDYGFVRTYREPNVPEVRVYQLKH